MSCKIIITVIVVRLNAKVKIVGVTHDKSIVRSRIANRIGLYCFHCNNLRRQSKSHAITHGSSSDDERSGEGGRGTEGWTRSASFVIVTRLTLRGIGPLGLAINNLSPNEETKRWSTERRVRHAVAGEEDTVRNANARATSVHQHHHHHVIRTAYTYLPPYTYTW